MSADKRSCIECEEPLLGRADQKFCSDQCRNAYNNRHNADANKLVRNINNALRKNRRILDECCIGTKSKVTREKLAQKGFNFDYFTSLYETKTGTVYHFCYELGYLPLEKEEVLVVRRKEGSRGRDR